MIPLGGPSVCAACSALMHEPTEACPRPYLCLTGPHCAACREVRAR